VAFLFHLTCWWLGLFHF